MTRDISPAAQYDKKKAFFKKWILVWGVWGVIAAPLSRLAMTEKAASENAVSLENKLGDVSLENKGYRSPLGDVSLENK